MTTAEDARRIAFWNAVNPFAVGRSRGQWIADVALFAIGSACWTLYAAAAPIAMAGVAEGFRPVDLAVGALAVVGIWWMRRYPLTMALAYLVPGALSLSAGWLALAAVYHAGSRARPLVAAMVTLAHIAVALPYHWVFPLPDMPTIVWVIAIPLVYALALSLGFLTRSRRQVIEGLRLAAERDRERYEEQLAALRRDEREQIAREMHDVLAHRLSLLSVHAGALEYRASTGRTGQQGQMTDAEIHEAAAVIRDNAHLAVEDLRTLLTLLRGAEAAESPLGTARPLPRLADVPALVEEAERGGQSVALNDGLTGSDEIGGLAQRTIYRVIQEGLTNARKHARHAPVTVDLTADARSILVSVVNAVPPGVTAAEIPGAGAGLSGLTERVRIDGGELDYGVADGECRLIARIPRPDLRGVTA